MKFDAIEFLKGHKELAGICVGSCILTGKWSKGERIKGKDNKYIRDDYGKYIRMPSSAHAHTNGPVKGYICLRSFDDLKKGTTIKHELSHVITGEGHTKKWAEKYVELGTPKWLTTDWLQKKYGFDDSGSEGNNLLKGLLKMFGIDENDVLKDANMNKTNMTATRAQQILDEAAAGPPDLRVEAYLCKLMFDGWITQEEMDVLESIAKNTNDPTVPNQIESALKRVLNNK
jgi:hypothetical protein